MIMITFNYKTFKDAQRCLAKPTCLVHNRWLTDLLFVSLYVDNWLNIILEIERVVDVDSLGLVALVASCFVPDARWGSLGRFWQRCCSSLPGPECHTANFGCCGAPLEPNTCQNARLPDRMSEHMSDVMPEKMSERMSEKMPEIMWDRMSEIMSE